MFKFILILVLSIYLLNKLSVFIFQILGKSQPTQPNFRRHADGKINVDAMPKKGNKKGGISGGEYVDYEEVK